MVSSSNKAIVEKYAKMLTDCAASNLSVRQYAFSHGISNSMLYKWIKIFKERISRGESFPGLVLPVISYPASPQHNPEIVEITDSPVSCQPRLSSGTLGTITLKNQTTLDISGDIAPEQLLMLIKAVSSC
jgi:transposase-like protein